MEFAFFILVALIVGSVCGVIGYAVGETKGRAAMGGWLGFLLGPIGILVAAMLAEPAKQQRTSHAAPAGYDFGPPDKVEIPDDWLK